MTQTCYNGRESFITVGNLSAHLDEDASVDDTQSEEAQEPMDFSAGLILLKYLLEYGLICLRASNIKFT